ncbi:MAG: glucose-1-phosphate adenylyltransferase [Pirellulaceae bacterium]
MAAHSVLAGFTRRLVSCRKKWGVTLGDTARNRKELGMRDVMTFVLGGGRGTRLYPLTKYRAKPAVPLAGKYRLIDIPLSNCIHSGINRIYVLTQFLSVSLHRHLRQAYRFDQFNGGFVELLAAQQSMEEGNEKGDWYQGTADAVRKNLRYIEQSDSDFVLILSGDQLYRMDYRDMLKTHMETQADVTIAALPVDRIAARSFGIMRIDASGRVQGFLEKPKTDEEINIVRMEPSWIDAHGIDSRGRDCLANMGIYLFNRETLIDVLTKTNYQDFGREIFPAAVRSRRVMVHLFDGYWEDIGTIKAFFESNLSLASATPPFQFQAASGPIYSRARFLPPTSLDGATIKGSLVAEGCRIGKGVHIENSIIGLRCVIGENVTIRNTIVMGADMYDSDSRSAQDGPPLGIGAGSVIEGAILDKNCRIGRNVRIVNSQRVENTADADDCVVRDGIPVVIKDSTLPDGWKL